MSAADIYAQCLLPLKEGYPLYRPELHRRLNDDVYDAYRCEGISIGDVGIIRPGGDFDFLFNICKSRSRNSGDAPSTSTGLTEALSSAGHLSLNSVGISEQLRISSSMGPFSRSSPDSVSSPVAREEPEPAMSERVQLLVPAGPHITPTNFDLIDVGEISITQDYVSKDRPYLAHGREEQTTFNAEASLNPIAVTPIGVGVDLGWTFECSSQRGAVMVAPDGATLTEVLEEERFLRSIESVGRWFKYAAEERHRRFKSLILVTGVIKCRSWSVAAISNTSRASSGKVAFSLMPAASGTLTASHSWRECIPTMCHSGPKPPSQTENQCVFVRGYRIMKQDPLLRLTRKVKATDLQEGSTEYYRLGKKVGPQSASGSGSSQRRYLEKTTVRDNFTDSSNKHYVIENLSNANEPYHPSDIINRYLLELVPDADFAMTHDKHWWALMRDNELSCPNEQELLARLCSTYKAVLRYGVVFLQEDVGNSMATTGAEQSTQTLTGGMLYYPLPPPDFSSSRKHEDRKGIRPNDTPSPVPRLPSPLNNSRRPIHGPGPTPSAFAATSFSLINATSFSPSPLPSPASPAHTSSPVSLPGPSTSHPWGQSTLPSENASSTRRSSVASSFMGDVLSPGDIVGEDIPLQGEPLHLLSMAPTVHSDALAQEFEVIKRLGAGSYAVVYLVREVLSRPVPSMDGHILLEGMELDDKFTDRPSVEYGRNFAIKCLSKANLDEEASAAQKVEIIIHQSLRPHENIVTLHRTLETSSYLLLLLEFVPGADLYYFLEPARDHYDSDSPTSEQALSSSRTPPTPSLLSNLHLSQLLSRNRLRLIASMFSQMCEAVAACHDQQVFHRDIKPENFIVTDGWSTLPDGRRERKVVVKLTDFGLSTADLESSEMDIGSAPYMSYECRNNVAPTYKPRAADVWSLGIVLINMLYHFNPWQDTADGVCNSFDIYRREPVNFFMQRFTGMTHAVAEYLATNVFCILEDLSDDSQRVEASEFGSWIKDLPDLLAATSASGTKRVISTNSTFGTPVAPSIPPPRLSSSRETSISAHGHVGFRSRSPSLGSVYEVDGLKSDQNLEKRDEEDTHYRSTLTNQRRKRGAREGKDSGVPAYLSSRSGLPFDHRLETLAVASQSLAREISKTSRSSSKHQGDLPLPVSVVHTSPVVTKKASKWKLGFGKNGPSGEKLLPTPVDEASSLETGRHMGMSATANNVTNLIMGLPEPSGISQSETPDADQSPSWDRGRHSKRFAAPVRASNLPYKWDRTTSLRGKSPRALSPSSTRSGGPVASSASSTTSSNWRSSTSIGMTSSSAFTSYSNNSSPSVSTQATSVSASSRRSQGTSQSKPKNQDALVSPDGYAAQPMPKNVKIMSGVPWELDQFPRHLRLNPVGDIFGSPPPRKQRVRKPEDQLDTIAERASMSPRAVSDGQEAMESHLEVEQEVVDEDGVPKVVQKGQINALSKMLSALRH